MHAMNRRGVASGRAASKAPNAIAAGAAALGSRTVRHVAQNGSAERATMMAALADAAPSEAASRRAMRLSCAAVPDVAVPRASGAAESSAGGTGCFYDGVSGSVHLAAMPGFSRQLRLSKRYAARRDARTSGAPMTHAWRRGTSRGLFWVLMPRRDGSGGEGMQGRAGARRAAANASAAPAPTISIKPSAVWARRGEPSAPAAPSRGATPYADGHHRATECSPPSPGHAPWHSCARRTNTRCTLCCAFRVKSGALRCRINRLLVALGAETPTGPGRLAAYGHAHGVVPKTY
eukprot:366253-Chlamydomonas_euryale.AAC.6